MRIRWSSLGEPFFLGGWGFFFGEGGKCFPVLAMLFVFLLPVFFFEGTGNFWPVFWTCFFAGGLFLAVYNGIHPCFCSPFSKRYCNIFLKRWKWESHNLWYNLAQKEFIQWGGNNDSKQNSHCLSCVLFLKESHSFLHLGFLEEPPQSFRLEEDFMHPQGFGMF